MGKVDRELTGEYAYWNGEIMAMKFLLLNIDRLLGNKKKSDRKFPHLIALFDHVGDRRKKDFNFFWSEIWKAE